MDVKKCSFCGNPIEPGTGKMFVRSDGSVYFFCSSKCESNTSLGRTASKIKWTGRAKVAKLEKEKPKAPIKKKGKVKKKAKPKEKKKAKK